jgi:ADP-ribose pyrophosphatase YjhB (NUDIX family)
MLVKVHALLWQNAGIAIHQERRQGELHRTLPGGRVLDCERLAVALRREVEEELGVQILVGRLLYVVEVVHGHSVHEVGLIFSAEALQPLAPATLVLDPAAADGTVFPPILDHVAADGPSGPRETRWLGNVWRSRT